MGHNWLWGHLAPFRPSKYNQLHLRKPYAHNCLGSSCRPSNVGRHVILYGFCTEKIASRGSSDVEHRVVAAGSRSATKAEEFIKETKAYQHNATAYGSYEQVYADKAGIYRNSVS